MTKFFFSTIPLKTTTYLLTVTCLLFCTLLTYHLVLFIDASNFPCSLLSKNLNFQYFKMLSKFNFVYVYNVLMKYYLNNELLMKYYLISIDHIKKLISHNTKKFHVQYCHLQNCDAINKIQTYDKCNYYYFDYL